MKKAIDVTGNAFHQFSHIETRMMELNRKWDQQDHHQQGCQLLRTHLPPEITCTLHYVRNDAAYKKAHSFFLISVHEYAAVFRYVTTILLPEIFEATLDIFSVLSILTRWRTERPGTTIARWIKKPANSSTGIDTIKIADRHDIRNQNRQTSSDRYFMHGVSHHLVGSAW